MGMKNFLGVLFVLVLGVVLSTTLFPSLLSFFSDVLGLDMLRYLRFDVCLVLTLYLGFNRALFEGIVQVAFFSYISDLFSPSMFGMYSFTNILLFLLVTILSKRLYIAGKELLAVYVIFTTFLQFVLIGFALIFVFDGEFRQVVPLLIKSLPQALFNVILAAPVFSALRWIDEKTILPSTSTSYFPGAGRKSNPSW